VVVVVLLSGGGGMTRAQDPLAGGAGDAFYPPMQPRRPQTTSRGMRPQWIGQLGFLAAGAATMKVLDFRKERKLKKRLEATTTSLEFKRVEAQQLNQRLNHLQYQVGELRQALYESEAEALQRDYDEFKAPDADDHDAIVAEEFFEYIQNYMRAYPNVPEDDYPTFRDFDTDASGAVTFNEWQAYLQQQQKSKRDSTEKKAASATSTKKTPPHQQQRYPPSQQQQRR